MANTLNSFWNGAVGLIDWLGPILFEPNFCLICALIFDAHVKRLMDNAINDDGLTTALAVHARGNQFECVTVTQPPASFVAHVQRVPIISTVRSKVVCARIPLTWCH